jgi:hypothetical protein
MSLRVKVWDLKRAVKYYSLYRGARYIDARYSESALFLNSFVERTGFSQLLQKKSSKQLRTL